MLLERLLARYESNVKNAEVKLEAAKKLHSEGLIDKSQIVEYEQALASDKDKLTETRQRLAHADEQIAETLKEVPTEEELAKEYRQARVARLRRAEPTCNNWTLNASRRQRGRSVVVVFRLVCSN